MHHVSGLFLYFLAIREHEANPRLCAESFRNQLPFLHRKFPGIEPLVKKLWRPSKPTRKLGILDACIG